MSEPEKKPAEERPGFFVKASDAWSDLVLTLPIFILYHLGVVLLPVRNAACCAASSRMMRKTSLSAKGSL